MIPWLCLTVHIILYMLTGSESTEKGRKCSKQSDCINLNVEPCAICVSDNDGQVGQCLDIYPNEYGPSPSCDKFSASCPLDCGEGKCFTEMINIELGPYFTNRVRDYFSPFCECTTNYGRTCQYDNPDNLPVFNSVRKSFNGIVQACKTEEFFFFFTSITEGSELSYTVIYYKYGASSYNIYDFSWSHPKYGWTFFEFKTEFPYESPGKVFKLGDKLIGYKTQIHMIVYHNGQLGFEEKYDVFVKYEHLRCFPKITTTNCGKSSQAPTVFLRSNQLQIKIDVDYIADGTRLDSSMNDESCSVDEKMYWKMWKINRGLVEVQPMYENYTRSRVISFDPFHLQIGVYELQIHITNVALEDPLTNKAHCFFKVKCMSLVAKVEGGSDRMLSSSLGLLLKADNSYDPNMPPNDQGHLNIEWSCVNILNPNKTEAICKPKQMLVSQYFYAPSTSLIPGAIYDFTLKLWTDIYSKNQDCDQNVSPRFVHVRVEIAPLNVTQLGNIAIECLENCGEKVVPSSRLFLKAVQPFIKNGTTHDEYKWTIYENEDKKEFVDKLSVTGVRSYLLSVNENSLNYGSNYTTIARVENSTWYAKYSFETYSIDFDAICTLKPERGTKGLTQFYINCTINENLTKDSLSIEFYDKNDKEKNEGSIFSGRMLGTSKDGHLKSVRLTRGNVMIYIFNQFGLLLVKEIKVVLKDWAIDDTILRELYQNVTNELRYGSVPSTLGALSFIPDVVPDTMEKNKTDILNMLLNFMTQISLNDFEDMKLCTSTLTNVLLIMNEPNQLSLKPYYIAAIFKNIKVQADMFSEKIVSGEVQNMNGTEVKLVTLSILNCLQAGLLSIDNKTENIDEKSAEFPALLHLRKASIHIEAVIDLISKTLSYVQVKGQPPTKLSSKNGKFVIWVMESDGPYTIPGLISTGDGIPVGFSAELYNITMKDLHEDEHIVLQVVSMTDNIFWWSLSDVRSNLVSVSLWRKNKRNCILPIRYVDKPINILVDLKDKLNTVTVLDSVLSSGQSSSSPSSMDLDYGIKIHRFDLAPRSLMSITFKYPQTNGTVRVYAMDDFRPDYAIVKQEGFDVTQGTPIYHVPYYDHEDQYFVYIGIMPGLKEPANQNVAYAFEINTTVCKIWVSGEWSSMGCNIRKVENGKHVNCECTHFSIFAAAFLVPPNAIDPFADAKLFLTVTKSPLVVGFVVIALLIYLLLCLCFWRFDKNVKKKRNVIVLEDNMFNDKIPYLIAVYTSSRLHSGTCAHVGMKIIGEKDASRSHVLMSKDRKVLQRNNDDWFLIYSPEHLGEVVGLHIWHDNTGSHPEWLCNKIFVYDLLENTETLFIIDEWLALNDNEYPEAFVLPASIEDIMSVKTLFKNNIVLGLREHHVFLSCIVCHPRSHLSRLHRLSIFFCGFMVAMLCSIMFFIPEGDRIDIDSYGYSFETRQFYVGIQTMVISVVASFIVFFSFQKSHKISYVRYKSTFRVREFSLVKKSVSYSYYDKLKNPIGGSVYRNFVRIISKTAKSNHMDPVYLPNSEPMVEVLKFWLILSWTVCITLICASSYLVMLYGLKLGLVRSKEWLSSLLVAMGGEIFFFGPIRIVFMSSLLAVAFLKMFDLNLHQVALRDLRRVKIPDDYQHVGKVISLRSHQMYRPLNMEGRDNILKKMERKRRRYNFFDFIITILIIVVLQNVMYHMWVSHFDSNSHAVNMMTLNIQDVLEAIHFFNIKTLTDLNKYLHYTFVPCLYNLRWYNDRLLSPDVNSKASEYWASDRTLRMLGLPVIRQLRTVPRRCDNIVINRGRCIQSWSSKNEDKDDYGEMWKPATWRESTTSNSPWRYTEKTSNYLIDQYRLFTPSGVKYTAGGYMVMLGPSRKDTELKLADLTENQWMDVKTRVVFVEFSLYNVNEDVFTKVTLVVEYFISGCTLTQARAMSFRTGKYLSVWSILFVLLIVYYLLRSIQLLDRQGIVMFIWQFSNICKLSIAILGISSLILYPVHYYVSKQYSESFHRKGLENYAFDFEVLALYYILLRHVVTLLLCFAILHALALIKLRRSFTRPYYTLVVSLDWIFWFAVAITIILFGLMLYCNIFDVTRHYNVKTLIMKERSIRDFPPEELQYLHTKVFAFIKIVIITIYLWSFVVYFIFFSNVARSNRFINK